MVKKQKSKQRPAHPSDGHSSPAVSLRAIWEKSWFPYLLFFGISLLYFITIFLKDVTFFSAESHVLAYKRFGWGSGFINPFAEDALWYNAYLGGMPASQGLAEYTHYLIRNILYLFVPEHDG